MALDDLIKTMNKEFKKELAVKGIGDFVIKRIPFTSPRLNYETYGGIPRGRISMFAGKESSGKSTTALDIVKNAFAGIRVCVCVLILNAVIKLFKSSVIDKVTLILFSIILISSIEILLLV